MFKSDNQLDVDSPYVLLTTNKSVVKHGLSTDNAVETESVLLTLQEGNLISFSEKVSTDESSGTEKPTIFIKFLDPEMVFLPRFFSQTSLRLYKTYFNKVKEMSGRNSGIDKMKIALKQAISIQAEIRTSPLGTLPKNYPAFQNDGKDTERLENIINSISDDLAAHEDEKTRLLDQINTGLSPYDDDSLKLYLKYGNGGKGISSPWRTITLNSFFISQDSSENMVITLTASHGALDSAQHKGVMSLEGALLKRESVYNSEPFIHSKELSVPILGATIENPNAPNNVPRPPKPKPSSVKSGTSWGAYGVAQTYGVAQAQNLASKVSSNFIESVLFYNEHIILSLLENLYQKFLDQYLPDDTSFVFLSPKIPYAIKQIIDSEISRQDASNTKHGLFGEKLEFRRLQVLETILNKCNISSNRLSTENIKVEEGPDFRLPIFSSHAKGDELMYLLSFTPVGTHFGSFFKTEKWGADDAVLDSINKLYNVLNITDSVIGNKASVAKVVSITNDEHKRAFLSQFCETKTQVTSTVVNKLTKEEDDIYLKLQTKEEMDNFIANRKSAAFQEGVGAPYSVNGVSITYANAYAIGDFGKDFKDHWKDRVGSLLGSPATADPDWLGVTPWVNLPLEKQGANDYVGITASNILIKDEELGNHNIRVYTDQLIGNGLINPLSPSYSNNILDIYIEQLMLPFRNTGLATKYSNTFKFIFDDIEEFLSPSVSLEKPIRDYILNVANIYGLNNPKKDYKFTDFVTVGTSEEENELKILESIPIFRANVENSNVYEVISTEKGTSFSLLLNTLNIMKNGARSNLTSALSPNKNPRILKFSSEEFDKSIDSAFGAALGNHATTYSLLIAMGELRGSNKGRQNKSIDMLSRTIFESVKRQTKKIIEESQYITDREIDYAGVTAHLNYIQSLSNNVAMVSVKTVPFFNLVEPLILGKPCVFLNNTNFHALTRGIASKGFLSGIYLISDYEHTISSSECYSKFSIQRQPLATEVMLNIRGGEL